MIESHPSFLPPACISLFVIHETEYLLIRRCGKYLPGTWQMVTGGIHQGETAGEAAVRELKEETGLTPISLYSADFVETFYMLSYDKITFVPVFACFVEQKEVILSPKEHDAYEWFSFEEAILKLVFREQKRALLHVHKTIVLQKPHSLLKIL